MEYTNEYARNREGKKEGAILGLNEGVMCITLLASMVTAFRSMTRLA